LAALRDAHTFSRMCDFSMFLNVVVLRQLRKEHGEDLWQMPSKDLKLIEDERIFIERPDLEDACHRESGC